MSGIATQMKHKSFIVNGTANHVHLLLSLNPCLSVSDTIHDIKRSSSLFINNSKLCPGKFAWQEGYGAFSYSRAQLDNVYQYILNQQEHHMTKTFRDEYLQFLKRFEIDYDERFLFDFF